MAFNSVSYFAGVGTVVVAIGVGFSGGVVMTGSGPKPEPPNRVERVAGSPPLRSAPSPQGSVPLGATTVADSQPTTAVSAPPDTVPPPPPSEPARAAVEPVQATSDSHVVASESSQQVQQSTAKSHDQDADARKQDADAKKVAERKQAGRRKWAARRQQHRQDDLDNAVAEVRKVDRPDDGQELAGQHDSFEMPRLSFFGQ